jgi:nitroreductase
MVDAKEAGMSQSITRRHLLRRGAAVALAARFALAGSAASQPPADDAFTPWQRWPDRGKAPRGLVHAAVLAANAHNTQPWSFCAGDDRIELFADEARNLGAMDPFRREMHISLGCALQNLVLASAADGFAAKVTLSGGVLSEPAGGLAQMRRATIHLSPRQPVASPLFAAIPLRHTNRGAYDADHPIGTDAIAALSALSGPATPVRLVLLTDNGERRDFAAATAAATAAIIADAAMIADSDAWFRATDREIAQHRDGPTIDAAGLSPWLATLAKILPAPSADRSHRIWLEQTRDVQLATAPLFGLILVRDLYDSDTAIGAGMLWQRLHLQATLLGLAAQPLNQLPEMVDRERQLGKPPLAAKALAALTDDPAWRPTFAFRMGWPRRTAPPSPRRALDDVIRRAAC